jgi:broad-specificity NMP kinase
MTILSNALIVLANAFRESGYNPPSKIEVDSQIFDKILAEAMELYNIDSKKAIVERKFSIKSIVKLAWNIINFRCFSHSY